MIGSRWKKLLTLFGTILALNFIFFTIPSAEDFNVVVKKKDIHPKISSHLWELEKGYKKRTMAAQVHTQEMITVFLFSEPGTIIDETSLRTYGAEIIKSADNVWKARVPVNMIETIADNVEGISFIKLPNRAKPLAVESEGVGLTGASAYHSAGNTGSGVKVAVIDVGFAGLSSAISAGELPNTVVRIDCTGSSCMPTDFSSESVVHGTGVAEIVHDMAPESSLYLIKVDDYLDLNQAQDYCNLNGINIINCSLGYNNENFYDGKCWNANSVCTAEKAYANGILWVNSMGNEAEKHYGGTFTDDDDNGIHDVVIEIEVNTDKVIYVELTWDAWPTTDQDYDLFLYDSSINLVASSETSQTGAQPPVEKIAHTVAADGTYHLVIKQYSATSNHRLAVFNNRQDIYPAVASSSLCNPADAVHVMAVGAIDYSDWATGPPESFSSQGPTNDSRIKPEISGPDRVSSYTYGEPFEGTSAASPHVAGAAALLLSRNPTYTVSQLWNALTNSAIDMGDSGQDNLYGFGRLNLPAGKKIPRYRLYNPFDFNHLYTTDLNEYNVLGNTGWNQEGIAYYIYDAAVTVDSVQATPFYRLYNPNNGKHHWTTDANENNVLATWGWIQEGVDGYMFLSQVTGSVPLYRLYNPNNGKHLWTMDSNERNVLIGWGWIDEGIAGYVFDSDS